MSTSAATRTCLYCNKANVHTYAGPGAKLLDMPRCFPQKEMCVCGPPEVHGLPALPSCASPQPAAAAGQQAPPSQSRQQSCPRHQLHADGLRRARSPPQSRGSWEECCCAGPADSPSAPLQPSRPNSNHKQQAPDSMHAVTEQRAAPKPPNKPIMHTHGAAICEAPHECMQGSGHPESSVPAHSRAYRTEACDRRSPWRLHPRPCPGMGRLSTSA